VTVNKVRGKYSGVMPPSSLKNYGEGETGRVTPAGLIPRKGVELDKWLREKVMADFHQMMMFCSCMQ